MKKKFILITALICLSVISVLACGCAGKENLYFKGELPDAKTSYEYAVSLEKELQSQTLKDKNFDANGTYKVETEMLAVSALPDRLKNNEIVKTQIEGEGEHYLYKATTTFNLTVNYDGCAQAIEDSIISTCYFCPKGLSYAPVFSTTDYSCTTFAIENGELKSARLTYSGETEYTLKNFTQKIADKNIERTVNYDFRKAVDNAQLLTVLSCLKIDSGSKEVIGTVSYSYGKALDLVVVASDAEKIGENEVVDYGFKVNDAYNSGIAQHLFVGINDGLIYRYVEPVLTASGELRLGDLIYNKKA